MGAVSHVSGGLLEDLSSIFPLLLFKIMLFSAGGIKTNT